MEEGKGEGVRGLEGLGGVESDAGGQRGIGGGWSSGLRGSQVMRCCHGRCGTGMQPLHRE